MSVVYQVGQNAQEVVRHERKAARGVNGASPARSLKAPTCVKVRTAV